MNDAMREAAMVDPAWARREQRKLWLLKAVTAGVLVALAVGVMAIVIGFHNETRVTNVKKQVTKIEHTACAKNAASEECQQIKAEAAKAASLYVTCIPFFKAGYPCPRPGSPAAERQAELGGGGGGSADQPASGVAGSSLPSSEPGAGGGAAPPSEHHHPAVNPAEPESSPVTGSPTSTQPVQEPVGEDEQGSEEASPSKPVLESLGGAVNETVETVNDTVGQVDEVLGGAACLLAGDC